MVFSFPPSLLGVCFLGGYGRSSFSSVCTVGCASYVVYSLGSYSSFGPWRYFLFSFLLLFRSLVPRLSLWVFTECLLWIFSFVSVGVRYRVFVLRCSSLGSYSLRYFGGISPSSSLSLWSVLPQRFLFLFRSWRSFGAPSLTVWEVMYTPFSSSSYGILVFLRYSSVTEGASEEEYPHTPRIR